MGYLSAMPEDWTPGEQLRIWAAEAQARASAIEDGMSKQHAEMIGNTAAAVMKAAIITDRALTPPRSTSPNRS
jgi:hypothetical protein